jgi:hypothetical protein
MAQPIVVSTAPEPANDTSTAFVAGATAVVAAQAAETADVAAEAALDAAQQAENARDAAFDAEMAVADVRADLAALEDRVDEMVGDLVAAFNGDGPAAGEVIDDGAPPVIVASGDADVMVVDDKATTDAPKGKKEPKPRGFGWDGWFGSR